MTRSSLPPLPRLGLLCLASLLLSSCPRAGVLPYGVEVSGEGETLIFKNVKAPIFSLESGTYNSSKTVELNTSTPDATIFYTISYDPAVAPETPTMSSTIYAAPIILDGYASIKAAAYINIIVYSFVSSGEFTFKLSSPDISYDSSTNQVTLASGTVGAYMRYLVNKTNPLTTSAGNLYSAPFTVAQGDKIRARAFTNQSGWLESDEVTLTIP